MYEKKPMEIFKLKYAITKLKKHTHTLDGLKSRLQMTKERVNKSEDWSTEIIQSETREKKKTRKN